MALGFMGYVLAAGVGISLFGCSTMLVTADIDGGTTVACACIGDGASAEYCIPKGEAGVLTSAPQECYRCKGGAILPSFLDGIGAVLMSAGKVLWGFL